MENEILWEIIAELVLDEYMNNTLSSAELKETKTEHEFYQKYISAAAKADFETGYETEEMYNAAVVEMNERDFKNGFITCLHLLKEYFDISPKKIK